MAKRVLGDDPFASKDDDGGNEANAKADDADRGIATRPGGARSRRRPDGRRGSDRGGRPAARPGARTSPRRERPRDPERAAADPTRATRERDPRPGTASRSAARTGGRA